MNSLFENENLNIKLNKIHDYLSSFVADTSEKNKTLSDSVHEYAKLKVFGTGSAFKRQSFGKITQPNSIHDFQERLSSFKYGSWMISGVSPIYCTRYGWKLKSSNMLQCVTCQALISTTLPPASQYDAYSKFLNHLKERVKSGHFDWCGWTCNQCPDAFACPALGFSVHYLESLKNDVKILTSLKDNLPLINTQIILEKLNLEEWQLHIFFENQDTLDEEQLTAILLVLTGWKLEKKFNLRCSVCLRNVGTWNFVLLKKKMEYLRLKKRHEEKLKRIEIQLASKKAKDLEKKKYEACKKILEQVKLNILKEEKRKAYEIAEKEAAEEEVRKLKREERRKLFEEVNYEQLIDQHINENEDEVDEKEEKYLLGEVEETPTVKETDLESLFNNSSHLHFDKIREPNIDMCIKETTIQTIPENLECCQENVILNNLDNRQDCDVQFSKHIDDDKSSNVNPMNKLGTDEKIHNRLNVDVEESRSPAIDDDEVENSISEVDNINSIASKEVGSSKSSNDDNTSSDGEDNTKYDDEDDLWLEAVGCDKVKILSKSEELCLQQKSKEIPAMKRKQSFDSDTDERDGCYRANSLSSLEDLNTDYKSNDSTRAKKRKKSADIDSDETVGCNKGNTFSSDELNSNYKSNHVSFELNCKNNTDINSDSSTETLKQISDEQISEVLIDSLADKSVTGNSLEEERNDFPLNDPMTDVQLVNEDVLECPQSTDSDEEAVEEFDTEEDHMYEKIIKSFFNPFEEHRSWCGWITQCSANGIECMEKKDLLGYLVLPQQLKHILPQSPRQKGNLLTSKTYMENIEGLREIRSTLYEWQLEDAEAIAPLEQSF